MIEFNIGGYILEYPKGSEDYANMFGNFLYISDNAMDALFILYNEAGGIETVLKEFPGVVGKILDDVIDACAKALYISGINMTSERFVSKYSEQYAIDYSVYYEEIVQKYSEILNKQREFKEYRDSVKAGRGRWQGGGFGMSGAIKGAMNAAILNLGTDFIHLFGDLAQENNHNQIIQKQLRELYNSEQTKGILCGGISVCIRNIYKALCVELEKTDFFEAIITMNEKGADSLYKSTIRYEEDPEIFFQNILQCIFNYPGNEDYYDAIREELIDELMDEESDFGAFLKFWNIEYFFADVKEEQRQFIEQQENKNIFENFVTTFDFTDYSPNQAMVMMNWLYENKEKIPSEGEGSKGIEQYLTNFRSKMAGKFRIFFEAIPQNIHIRDFLDLVNKYQEFLRIYPLRAFWPFTYGAYIDASSSQKAIAKLESNGDAIILAYAAEITGGKVGKTKIAITKKYVMDFDSEVKIEISDIKEINVIKKKKSYALSIYDDLHNIEYEDNIFENRPDSYYYMLKDMLSVMFIRYNHNSFLLDKTVSESKLQISNDILPYGYCEIIGEEVLREKELYESYLKDGLNLDQLRFSNVFRRRAKLIMDSKEYPKNQIYKYDYEINDTKVLALLDNESVKGQYILYCSKTHLLTDQNLYLYREKFDLQDIKQILLYKNRISSNEFALVVDLKNGKTFTMFCGMAPWEVMEVQQIIYMIDVALEESRGIDSEILYDKKDQYICGICKSREFKVKIFGLQCANCGNSKYKDLFELVKASSFINQYRTKANNVILTQEKSKNFFMMRIFIMDGY